MHYYKTITDSSSSKAYSKFTIQIQNINNQSLTNNKCKKENYNVIYMDP